MILLTGCGKVPTANFETDKEFYYAGETVHFKNTSSQGESYRWVFPDGNISEEKEPSFVIPESVKDQFLVIELKAYSKKERKSNSIIKSINLSLPVFSTEFFSAAPDSYTPYQKTTQSFDQYYYNQYIITVRSKAQADKSLSELIIYFTTTGRPEPGIYQTGADIRFQLRKIVNDYTTANYEPEMGVSVEVTAMPNNYLKLKFSNIQLRNSYDSFYSSTADGEIIF
ncbi:MAG TPA: hypothetical protein VK622_06320 [Puia sp.]|nr:hypothetical protein [Puia sp.]